MTKRRYFLWGGIINLGTVGEASFWPEKSVDDKWQPGENTVAYYPFLNDTGEVTGKSSGINTGVTITTLNGVKCGYFNGSSRIETNISAFTDINHTLACWIKRNGGNTAGAICANPCGVFSGDVIYPSGDNKYVYQSYATSNGGFTIESNTLNQSEWHCVIFTGGKLYVDGILQGSGSGGYRGGYVYTIGGHTTNSSCTRQFLTGYMGDVVIDNSVWTDAQIAAYYNKTRSRYVS